MAVIVIEDNVNKITNEHEKQCNISHVQYKVFTLVKTLSVLSVSILVFLIQFYPNKSHTV